MTARRRIALIDANLIDPNHISAFFSQSLRRIRYGVELVKISTSNLDTFGVFVITSAKG